MMKHIVKSGETLSGIGQKYNVPWKSIASVNGIVSPYVIRVGQSLTIPTGSSGGGSTNTTTKKAQGASANAMDVVVNEPLNMVIGGVLLYGLFKIFMKIF